MRQLVLPEALKLLPLYTLGLIKHPFLGDRVPADERMFHIAYALHMPIYQSLPWVHPHLYSVHNLKSSSCVVSESGRVLLPPALQLTKDTLRRDGIYVMDTGRKIFICIGDSVNPTLFEQAFEQLEEKVQFFFFFFSLYHFIIVYFAGRRGIGSSGGLYGRRRRLRVSIITSFGRIKI